MVYFLIQLYKQALNFPRFQYVSIPIHYAKCKWKAIREVMTEYADYWRDL